VGTQGKFKLDLGSIEVTSMGSGYALSVTPFVMTENPSAVFARQIKGVSTLVWKRTPEGGRSFMSMKATNRDRHAYLGRS
jgi:hypothetical protein